jgi:hypothetical protein
LNNKSIEPFKIKRNIKKLSYKLDLLKKMWIHSVFHASMLQCCNQFIPLQITETFVESDKEYQVENILENEWLARKLTISSNERSTTPLKTHENS